MKGDFEFYNTLAFGQLEDFRDLAGKVYNYQLLTKALLLSSSIKIRERIQNSRDENLKVAYLYVNAKGKEVQSHSYSGGDTLKFCPAKYKLSRIDGWNEREKDLKASLKFGIAMESALRFHHENGMAGGPEEFVRLWTVFKDMADMKFTPVVIQAASSRPAEAA